MTGIELRALFVVGLVLMTLASLGAAAALGALVRRIGVAGVRLGTRRRLQASSLEVR